MCNFFAQVSLLGAVRQGCASNAGVQVHAQGCSARLTCVVELLVGWSGAPVQAPNALPPAA